MSRKAYFLPITNSQEAQDVLNQLQAADIEINFAITGPQLFCWDEPQGTPLADGQFCYLAFTTEGSVDRHLDQCPALADSFRLDGVEDDVFNENGRLIGGTYLDDRGLVQYLVNLKEDDRRGKLASTCLAQSNGQKAFSYLIVNFAPGAPDDAAFLAQLFDLSYEETHVLIEQAAALHQ